MCVSEVSSNHGSLEALQILGQRPRASTRMLTCADRAVVLQGSASAEASRTKEHCQLNPSLRCVPDPILTTADVTPLTYKNPVHPLQNVVVAIIGSPGGVEKSHSEPFGFAPFRSEPQGRRQDRLREESLLAVNSSVPCAKDPSSASRRTQDDTADRFFNSPTVPDFT